METNLGTGSQATTKRTKQAQTPLESYSRASPWLQCRFRVTGPDSGFPRARPAVPDAVQMLC